ncbi:hypothetical protein FCV25MIE_02418, partial [Fagus crenata]
MRAEIVTRKYIESDYIGEFDGPGGGRQTAQPRGGGHLSVSSLSLFKQRSRDGFFSSYHDRLSHEAGSSPTITAGLAMRRVLLQRSWQQRGQAVGDVNNRP